jgi:hypothetical protein
MAAEWQAQSTMRKWGLIKRPIGTKIRIVYVSRLSVACQRCQRPVNHVSHSILYHVNWLLSRKIIIPARFYVPLFSHAIAFNQSQHQDFLNRDFESSIKSLLLDIINTCDYACVLMYVGKLAYNPLRSVGRFRFDFDIPSGFTQRIHRPLIDLCRGC